MTAWTTISNLLVAVGAKPFATTIQALRDNPVAIAEGATGAPVLSTGWHPYDMTNVGDGSTGLFYDVAVSGATSTITTPTFEDGYDYLFRWVGLSPNGGGGILRVAGVNVSGSISAANSATGFMELLAPTLTNWPKLGRIHFRESSGSSGIAAQNSSAASPFNGDIAFSAMASALTSVALDWSTGASFDAGQGYLYRRRNFMFG